MRKRRIFLTVFALICVLCTMLAIGCSDKKTYYTVTFMDGQTQIGQSIEVEKGKRISEYPAAAREDKNYVFDAWFKDEELSIVWNNDIERITKNVTLYAGFLYVLATPGNATMDGSAFSNTLTWLQRDITSDTEFNVEILGTDIVSGGKDEFTFESYKGHNDIYTVKWTPTVKPMGGTYSAKIACGDDEVTVDNLVFKGAGIESNPYLISSQNDLDAVNTQDISGNFYKVAQSFTARTSSNKVADKIFDGVLDGNGKTVTLEASDFGLFGILGENAEVKDITVAGAVANVQADCVGALAGINKGKISYCTVSANLESALGIVGTLNGDKDGIEGGIAGVAGINYGEISCCSYSATVKSNVGGAGIAVINNGTVSLCSFKGTIGAANSNETGNSTKAYSYIGGIVAINYAVVEKSSIDGSGKILAQRGESGANDYVGGIVAVNETGATVSECWFDGIRVHGNKNVGGIAGANAGTIAYCYAGGDYHGGNANTHSYIGGLSEVGGIVGLMQSGGTVANCFVTSNIYAYEGNAYKVASACSNCVYLNENLDSRDGVSSVTASEDNGNIKIVLEGNYSGKAYPLVLTNEQLAVLNGAGEAFTNKSNVRLICEGEEIVVEHIITVSINGEVIGTVSDADGNKISLKNYIPEIPDGYYFAGWATSANGEAVFDANEQVGYTSLEKYGNEVTLYPVLIEGEKPQSKVLNVAVWTRYVEEDTAKALFEAYKSSSYFEEGYEVVYTALNSSNNNNFKSDYEKGEYNVAFGYKAAAVDEWQLSSVEIYIYSVSDKAMSTLKVGLNSSDDIVASFGEFLKSDTAKKIMNPDFISEDEADKVVITLMNGGEPYGEALTVSNATEAVDITLPEMTADDGYSFMGWALTAEAEEDEIYLSGKLGYKDVKDFATGGTLTLYARYKEGEKPQTLSVAIWTKYVEPDTVTSLLTAFENSEYFVEGALIDYGNLTSDKNADFKADYENGGYNIAFGYKAAAVDSWQTKIVEIYIYNVSDKVMSTLKVGVNSTDDIALNFAEFLVSDEAKKIMNPDYVSEAEANKIVITLMNGETEYGEKFTVSNATEAEDITLPDMTPEDGYKFLGWAVEDGETYLSGKIGYKDVKDLTDNGTLTLYARYEEIKEDEPVVLKVAVYKKFIDQPVVDALISAFEKYCKDNKIKCDTLQIDLITTGNGTKFTSEASNYDVALGHKGGTSFKSLAELTVAMMLNADNGGAVANDRKAERLTDSDIAKDFMSFLETDEGKAAMIAVAEVEEG